MSLNNFLKKLKARANRLFTKSNRNLLVELIRANFKATDHNSILGVSWILIGPVTMLLVMYFLFRSRFGQEVKAYPLYLLVGIISVNFFITSTVYMMKIFFVNREFILNSTVPRENIIASSIFIPTYKFIIELILCLILSIFYGIFKWKFFLLVFPLLLAYIGLVLGVSLILSLLYCFARDIEHIWMIVSRLLFFATPVFYTLDNISQGFRKIIYWLNPLTPFVVSFQGVFMGGINLASYIHSLLIGIIFFILGYSTFVILENTVIERV